MCEKFGFDIPRIYGWLLRFSEWLQIHHNGRFWLWFGHKKWIFSAHRRNSDFIYGYDLALEVTYLVSKNGWNRSSSFWDIWPNVVWEVRITATSMEVFFTLTSKIPPLGWMLKVWRRRQESERASPMWKPLNSLLDRCLSAQYEEWLKLIFFQNWICSCVQSIKAWTN